VSIFANFYVTLAVIISETGWSNAAGHLRERVSRVWCPTRRTAGQFRDKPEIDCNL